MRVLLIDGSTPDREALAAVLTGRGFRVQMVAEGSAGLDLLARQPTDIVIVGAELLDGDGYVLCERIRELSPVPLIMLSGQTDEVHVVRGLAAGADTFLPRTVGEAELVARLGAVFRRYQSSGDVQPTVLELGDLVIDSGQRLVLWRGRDARLTAHEFRLLYCLAVNAGLTVTRGELADWMWGSTAADAVNRLEATVSRLRRKLGEEGAPGLILTVPGVGYSLAALPSPQA